MVTLKKNTEDNRENLELTFIVNTNANYTVGDHVDFPLLCVLCSLYLFNKERARPFSFIRMIFLLVIWLFPTLRNYQN